MNLTGLSPQNPNKYVGPGVYLPILVTVPRAPTGADIKQPSTGRYYSFGTFWLVGKNPTTGTYGDLWYLSNIVANVGNWVQLTSSALSDVNSIAVDNFTGPGTNPVTPASGVITVTGGQVASGVIGANVIRTNSLSANTFTVQIQRTGAAAATDSTLNGVAHFDSASFTVDSSGFVQLLAPATGTTSFGVQANTAPGTNPVLPTGGGLVTINGAVVANHSVVLETRSRAANAFNIEVQYAASAVATTANKSGVAHFKSSDFTVDGSGFVSLASPTSGLTTVTGLLTSAQIKALKASPVTTIAAQGAGTAIIVTAVALKFNYGGTNVFVAASSQNVKLYYSNVTQLSGSGISNATLVGTTTTIQVPTTVNSLNVIPANIENLPVTFFNDQVAEISGNAANNNTITYSITYFVVAI